MKEILVLKDLECIKAIAHPRRIDILKAFKSTPLSAKQLSQLLDEPHAKINYHIKTLYKVGVLDLVEEKIKSGIVEKYYYPKAKHIVVGKKILNFSIDSKNVDEGDICISKFEDVSDSFYKAMEEHTIGDENITKYSDVSLSQLEIKELLETIDSKINDILSSRKNDNEEQKYDVSLITIPVDSELECNI